MTSKRQLLEQLLEQGMVLVALDTRKVGVDVPAHVRDDPQLRLNLSYRFGLPLRIDDWGVHATLTFNNQHYPCRLPWTCVFLIVSHVSGQPVLFPDDIPMELLAQPSGENKDGSKIPPSPAASRPMSMVPRAATAAALAMTDDDDAGRHDRRPRLSLVGVESEDKNATSGSASAPASSLPSDDDPEPTPPNSPTPTVVPVPDVDRPAPSRGHLRLVK